MATGQRSPSLDLTTVCGQALWLGTPTQEKRVAPTSNSKASEPPGLFRDPDVQHLVAFARSDNPLVALGIERREVFWTQFMGCLLDPVRRGENDALAALQAMLDRAGGGRVDRIRSVAAEASEGKEGRSDVAIECVIDGRACPVIIENKVDAAEHADQLAGYASNRSDQRNLRALLIELGDRPVGTASLPEAICWDRRDAEAWLTDVLAACDAPHPLASAYRDLFEAWDLAGRIRVEFLHEIDAMHQVEDKPAEWGLVRHWLRPGDSPFFEAMLNAGDTRRVIDRLGLEVEDAGRKKADAGILKLSKPTWTLYPQPGLERGVNVHFEVLGRTRLLFHVEVFPYKGLANTPELLDELADVLALKAEVHTAIRTALRKQDAIEVEFTRLRAPDAPGANKAAGFPLSADVGTSPSRFAAKLRRVVKAVTPLVDRVMGELRQSHGLV